MSRSKISIVHVGIILSLMIIVSIIFAQPIGNRVGDGMEYYAMLISIINSGQVFATHESLLLYDNYVMHTSTLGFLQSEFLQKTFPMLVTNEELDFPHFWFYSVLAAPFGLLLKIASLDIGYSFTLLHISLFILLSYIAYREYNKLGVIVILMMILCSPAIWFINKAHTEFFTITMSIVGLIYFTKNKYLQSSLFFALIATQNPPFAIISILLVIYALFNLKSKIFNYKSIAFLIVIGAIIALHPLYYYFRLGVITPQFLLGAANDAVTLHRMLTWFFDPDVGLFLNWPFGLIIVFIGLLSLVNHHFIYFIKTYKFHLLFYILYVIILSYSQSKTGNLNHGATVYISRYALWYVALFFPIILYIVQYIYEKNSVKCMQTIMIFCIFSVGIWNIYDYFPNRVENYTVQTKTSKLFFRIFPSLWNPEPEIFVERALGREGIPNNWAIFRDNKILINNTALDKENSQNLQKILNAPNYIDTNKVYEKAIAHKTSDREQGYFYLYGPFDEDYKLKDYRVKIDSIEVKKLICSVGAECSLKMKISNISQSYWSTQNLNGKNVYLSYHIANTDGIILIPDGMRTKFPHDIAEGVSIPMTLKLKNSFSKGNYILLIDLVHEHVSWFSSYNKENTYAIPLEIL